MDLQSDRADAQTRGGLPVEETAHHQRQYLTLARRQRLVTLPQKVAFRFQRRYERDSNLCAPSEGGQFRQIPPKLYNRARAPLAKHGT